MWYMEQFSCCGVIYFQLLRNKWGDVHAHELGSYLYARKFNTTCLKQPGLFAEPFCKSVVKWINGKGTKVG